MDDKQHPTQPDGNSQQGKRKAHKEKGTSQDMSAGSRKVFGKRWLFPAIYLGAAALIIGLMYARSQMASHPVSSSNIQDTGGSTQTSTAGSTNTIAPGSTYDWPVASSVTPTVTKGFFESSDSPSKQAAEMVSFGNGSFSPHLGYDIKAKDGSTFTVTAATAGQVTKVGHSVLNNYTVVIQSNDGNVEKYESLGVANVKVGDTVQQGEVIGTSGTCEYEQSQGNHLYFEVDNGTTAINPDKVLPKL